MTSDIVFIIDTSYSIAHFVSNYVDSINNIIRAQLSFNKETRFSIVSFNEKENYICINEQLGLTNRKLTNIDLKPNGCTALYDNVSGILNNMTKFYENTNQKSPLIIIITDGDDTCSKLLKKEHLALQISRAKWRGWKFIFLGVNEDSIKFGKDLGCNISIHYNTSEECFQYLPNVFKELFATSTLPEAEIDVDQLIKNMSNIKL